MKRVTVSAASFALAASLLLPFPAAAGGWATVTVVGPESAPVAGAPWPLEVQVLQHGVTPIDWEQISVVGRDSVSGMVAAANGRPAETVGNYVLNVVFPETGDWVLEFGLHELAVEQADSTRIKVAEAVAGGAADTALSAADGSVCD